jgi:hypothetical protein
MFQVSGRGGELEVLCVCVTMGVFHMLSYLVRLLCVVV